MAPANFANDELVCAFRGIRGRPGQVLCVPDTRSDLQATGRRSSQVRDVEIGQHDLAERSRNRRGGHQEHVRRTALGAESLTLCDAEPVLLVDHGEREICEVDRLLHEGVRPDDDPATREIEQAPSGGR